MGALASTEKGIHGVSEPNQIQNSRLKTIILYFPFETAVTFKPDGLEQI